MKKLYINELVNLFEFLLDDLQYTYTVSEEPVFD